jgi:hypothetical protein
MTLRRNGLFAALILCGTILCGTALAQTATTSASPAAPSATQPTSGQVASPTTPAPTESQSSNKIAAGSVIPVQLTKTIDAKKAKAGDQVEAKVTQDLKNGQGQVIVTKDTKVLGHVTEAQARNKEQKESQVGIAFDHAVMKNGGDVQLPMSIQAVIGPMNSNANASNDNNQNASPSSSAPAAGASGAGPARAGGMGTGASSAKADTATASNSNSPNDNGANQGRANGPITGNTQGVVGISDLKLSAEPTPAQGSMLSSEKNNVKLESGTLLLLKVNQ